MGVASEDRIIYIYAAVIPTCTYAAQGERGNTAAPPSRDNGEQKTFPKKHCGGTGEFDRQHRSFIDTGIYFPKP